MNERGKIGVLMFLICVCGSVAVFNRYFEVRREQVRPADLYEAVNSQLKALRNDDFSVAYEHASMSVQQKLNLRQFTEKARGDYDRISRAEHVEFGTIEVRGRRAMIQVFFIDREGRVTPCVYNLINEGDAWKINSVRVMRRWPAGERLSGIRT
jgi:uncharacterized protein DUF4864